MAAVEALLYEVTPLFGSLLALKTADHLFFGDRVVYGDYSNVGPSSSKEFYGKAQDAKDHKKKKENHGKNSQKARPDGLEAALLDVKKTIQSALHDEAGDRINYEAEIERLKNEIEIIKKDNNSLHRAVEKLNGSLRQILSKVNLNEPKKIVSATKVEEQSQDNEFDLFGSSDEEVDEEKQRVVQDRLKAYAEKKAKKPISVAKSSVILDVKPWDDETDMTEMEKKVRTIEQDGLVWGGSKLIPLAYGLKKLQIICVIEDEKVSVDDLIDSMVENISEHIQSVDIVAFNKI